MAKKTQQDLQNVDRRLVDRFVERGDFGRADLDAALEKLPDMKEAAEDISDVVYGNASNEGSKEPESSNEGE